MMDHEGHHHEEHEEHEGHEGHNHEVHEAHEGHEGDEGDGATATKHGEAQPGEKRFGMRLPSPLPPHVEAVTAACIGCAIAVHRQLGPGFLESTYRRAMRIELTKADVAYESEKRIDVLYDGIAIHAQRLDLIVAGAVIVELKSVKDLQDIHLAQLVSYLRATRLRAGLLINFRVNVLRHGIKRIVL